MPIVLHLMPNDNWERLSPGEAVTNPSLAIEGFIHCTDDAAVLLQVANAFYREAIGDFIVLHVEVEDLTSACLWEEPAHIGGQGQAFAPEFPHIYGPIDRVAVRWVQPVRRDADGTFVGYGVKASA